MASAFAGYETTYARQGWAEQDPEAWWRAVCDSTQALLRDARVTGRDVACVSFSGQMMGCVPLDERARPLRDAIIWADQRAIEQVGRLAERIAPDEVYRLTGHRLGDGCCAALGAGIYRERGAYNYVGSSSWIALATARPVLDPEQRTFTWAHVVPGLYSPCGTMQAAGASYQWAREQLGQAEVEAATRTGASAYDLLNEVASTSPTGAGGLLYLPYLLGERSPHWNPDARGAFVGLTMRHTRADLVRAVLEGVTLNLRVILDALTRQGIGIERVRVIGGGAQGRFWNQLMADVYGLPVDRLSHLEAATSMGAAVVGGVGVGLYPGFGIIERMNPVAERFAPDPAAHEVYQRALPLFEATYTALEPVFEQLAGA